jgi:ribosomal protein S18 acetylase RimI-like enzyme
MELRPFESEDWGAVCEIYDCSKPDELRGVVEPGAILPLDADPAMKALFRDSRIVVTEDAGRIIGFAGNRDSFITWLFVHPASRRKGVATAMVRQLLGQLEGTVTLNVMKGNIAALALYQSLGFALEREFPGNFQGIPCTVARLRHETAA